MKAYLNDMISSRDTDRTKSKNMKQTVKNKSETHKEVYHSNYPKIKLKVQTNSSTVLSLQKRKNHQRVQTESQERKFNAKGDNLSLNKTQSKSRIKTQMGTYNSETIKSILDHGQKHVEIEDNPFWGTVKQKLQNDSKNKKTAYENSTIKKLMELTSKARDIRSGSSLSNKNPEQCSHQTIKSIHLSMDLQVQMLKQELVKRGDENRQSALCDLVSQMVGYAKSVENNLQKRQNKMLKHVRQIQERNVKLISLMNRLKQQGVDVDSFWVNSQYSSIQRPLS